MNWHKRFQAITHAYIETKMKNTIWRLITGKLYLGDIAQKYLIFRKKPQAAIKYEYCPYCSNTFNKSTIQHQFWDCPCIQKFWALIRDLFNQLEITFPVRFTQRGRPPRGQSVSFGEKFVVFEVDERLLYVVEMILI